MTEKIKSYTFSYLGTNDPNVINAEYQNALDVIELDGGTPILTEMTRFGRRDFVTIVYKSSKAN